MVSIKNEDIKSIYLLSAEEAKSLPKSILAIGEYWWLRSPGYFSYFAAFVLSDGSVVSGGSSVNDGDGAVRPALKIKNLKSLNLEIGETVKVLGLMAQYIGGNSVLLCESIAKHRFDIQLNVYETSEVKRFIEKWLEKKKMEMEE